MRANELLTESLMGRNKNKIYSLLLTAADSGPFDGGCVIMAQAIQMKYGGDIVVLVGHAQRNTEETAQHAAIELGNLLVDADGPLAPKQFIQRFEKNELLHVDGKITGVRPIQHQDLPDAPRNEQVAEQIARLLK
jgi:hypothetical protein